MNEALLKALHILTRDGKMNQDSRRKLKQVQHLAQLIEPFIKKVASTRASWTVADLGAGKSYLGFILYDLIVRNFPSARILAVESRPELVETSRKLAAEAGFERMDFRQARIDEVTPSAALTEAVEIVTALHACDTATDDAIVFGLARDAQVFALVPCCQAEVARQLEPLAKAAAPSDRALFEFPLHRREFGSHLTNVIRSLYLKSLGYRVTVTELVGWEHSMKNELILAERISTPDHPESRKAALELEELLRRFPVRPKVLAARSANQ